MRIVPFVLALLVALPQPASAAEDRLILQPEPGTILRIEGHYPQREGVCPSKQRRPLLAKYRGSLELRIGRSGSIEMINGLSFSEYLRGLAEMPTSWPLETLRAQVVAARSYALATMRDERDAARRRGYDICATDRCQVYRGATVELGAFGDRWVEAVESTRGKVMTYRNSVIKAFYFSTSTGTTRNSFYSRTEGPAWLDNVDAKDADAPLARWTTIVPLSELRALLAEDAKWSGGTITGVRERGDEIVLSGAGRQVALSKSSLRSTLNSEGPCLFPDRYPPREGSQTGGRLPLTVPSSTYSLKRDADRIVITGRGWGHDVGMSQYGARYLADEGMSYDEILDHYYNHQRLETISEPEQIKVLAAEGMRRVRIAVEGSARVTTGTGSTISPSDRFEVRIADGALRVLRGKGPGLRSLTTVTASPATVDVEEGATEAAIRVDLSRAAKVRVVLRAVEGAAVGEGTETSFESGEHAVTVPLLGDDGNPLPPGEYRATVIADDGLDEIRSEPVAITIAAPAPTPPPPDGDDGPSRALPIGLAVIVLLAAGGLLVARRARGSGGH